MRLLQLEGLPISHDLRLGDSGRDPGLSVRFDGSRTCGLLQIVEAPPLDLLYSWADADMTGIQKLRHFDDLIATTIARQDRGRAVDVGCNDGAFLEALGRAGYTDLVGVEPNKAAAAIARDLGHNVHVGFLTSSLADRLVAEGGRFRTVFLRHVVEHVSALDEFFDAARRLLTEDGVLVVELPEIEETLFLGSPAILWEEHLSYFSSGLAEHILEQYGFAVSDRRRYAFGGGSLSYVARKGPSPGPRPVPAPKAAEAVALLQDYASGLRRQAATLAEVVVVAGRPGGES